MPAAEVALAHELVQQVPQVAPVVAVIAPVVPELATSGRLDPGRTGGFGAGDLADEVAGIRAVEPPPLAGVAVRQAGRFPPPWNPASLVAPLYLRPPSASPARRRADG